MRQPHLHFHEIRPTVYVACFDDRGKRPGHSVDYRVRSHHLILIESGRIEAEVNGEPITGKAGDLICFRSTDSNRYSYSGGTRTFQVQLEFAPPPQHRLTPWLDGVGPLPEKVAMKDLHEEMRAIFETVCMALPRPGMSARLRLRGAIFEMLSIVASVGDPSPRPPRRVDPWRRVLFQLDGDLSAPISVRKLAGQLRLSADGFIRGFKTRFGMTPKAYHMRMRLREAARLIYSTDKPIKEIAYVLGFSDPKYFSRQFRRHQSARPSEIRRSRAPSAALSGKTARPYPVNNLIFPPREEDRTRKWLTEKGIRPDLL